jgi:alpha-D-xyloside xylohydrolase
MCNFQNAARQLFQEFFRVNDVTYRSNRSVGFNRRFFECFNVSCIASWSKSLVTSVFGRSRTSFVLLCILGSSVQGFADNSRGFAVESYKQDGAGVTIMTSQGLMRIDVCTDRIIHVLLTPEQSLPKQPLITVTQTWNQVPYSLKADNKRLLITTAALKVEIARDNGAVAFFSLDGKPVLQEAGEASTIFTPEVETRQKTWQVQQTFLSPKDEALYGLGQHQEGWFNLRGIPFRLQQANTNISIPIVLSTKGYGLIWNNASITDFNPADQPIEIDQKTGAGSFHTEVAGDYGFLLASDRTEQLRLKIDGKPVIDLVNMWVPDTAGGHLYLEPGDHTVLSKGGKTGVTLTMRSPSDRTTFRSRAGESVDYYFLYGPDLDTVVGEYREATGEAPLFPKWAYGFWQCRERYSSQQQILDTAAEFRKRHIPVDAFVQDWLYWDKYGWNAMKFDEDHYPDPAHMMDILHQENLHLVISVWPKFGTQTDVYKQLKSASLLIPGETPTHEQWLDAFNPKARSFFWQDIDQGLFKDGLDGWWLDASEPEFDPLAGQMTYLGPGDFVKNAYPLYETTAVYQGQRAATNDKRVVILTRSAFLGQQRNAAASWSGDISGNWETFRRQIPAGLNFSMSGLPYWTTDVGGFFRPKDEYTSEAYHELLIRWFEYGAFSPIFRIHGYQSETEMWKFGPKVEQILHQYDDLRYRLLPYVYSVAWNVTSQDGTMMRALPLEYPKDVKVREIGDQFLFGPSLLINPVTKPGATTREVYLPAGSAWFDLWTGKKSEGGQTIRADAPIERMPIFVKSGSILALGPVVDSTEEKQDPTDVRIYPGQDGHFVLYDDEGDSYRYEKGSHSTISLDWNDRKHTLTVGDRQGSFPGMSKERTFRIFVAREGTDAGINSQAQPSTVVHYNGAKQLIAISQGQAR